MRPATGMYLTVRLIVAATVVRFPFFSEVRRNEQSSFPILNVKREIQRLKKIVLRIEFRFSYLSIQTSTFFETGRVYQRES